MIPFLTGQHSSAQVERMIKEAQLFEEDDEREKQRVQAKNDLERQAYKLKARFESGGDLNKSKIEKIQMVSQSIEIVTISIDFSSLE